MQCHTAAQSNLTSETQVKICVERVQRNGEEKVDANGMTFADVTAKAVGNR